MMVGAGAMLDVGVDAGGIKRVANKQMNATPPITMKRVYDNHICCHANSKKRLDTDTATPISLFHLYNLFPSRGCIGRASMKNNMTAV